MNDKDSQELRRLINVCGFSSIVRELLRYAVNMKHGPNVKAWTQIEWALKGILRLTKTDDKKLIHSYITCDCGKKWTYMGTFPVVMCKHCLRMHEVA